MNGLDLNFDDDDIEVIPNSNLPAVFGNGTEIVFDKMIEGMSNEDYHDSEGVSSTQFQLMRLSNRVFDLRRFFRYEKPAYSMGSLIHDAILLPHLVDAQYTECITKGMDTVAYHQQVKDFPELTVVGQGDISKAKDIAKLTMLVFGFILVSKDTKKEVSFFHRDKETGMVFRIRPDIYNKVFSMLMDVKSTKANNHREFERIIEEYDYDLSMAFYYDVLLMCGYPVMRERTGWICVPNTAPHAPFAYIISDELLEKGRSKYQTLLVDYMAYKKREQEEGENNSAVLFDDLFSKQAHSWAYRKSEYENLGEQNE